MCPDRQLLSVYIDGELASPWKEKMESHLAQCPQCSKLLENYRQLSPLPQGSMKHVFETALLEKSKERVWKNLEEKISFGIDSPRHTRIWERRISLPLPAAAAAALAIIVFSVFWTMRPNRLGTTPNAILASEENSIQSIGADEIQGYVPQELIPATSMNEVLQYLGSREGTDILILRLPESRSFSSFGTPTVIRAADYSRTRP